MIAIKRLQSIMWILIAAAGALTAYLISLNVATERNAVAAVERQIYATRTNIRYLEVEFSARSSMRQLAEWNARDIKYAVPGPTQYIRADQQVALLDGLDPRPTAGDAQAVMAALDKQAPVMPLDAPVKAEPQVIEQRPAVITLARGSESPAPAPARVTLARSPLPVEPANARPALAKVKPETAPRIVQLVDKVGPAARREMRLAALEQTLLEGRAPDNKGQAEAGKAVR